MTAGSAVLGACPDCQATVSAARVLITYESAAGRPAMFADCPGCRDVIRPV